MVATKMGYIHHHQHHAFTFHQTKALRSKKVNQEE
jgi:hypothetical protein